MPIHDWTRVPAGLFHDFHQTWCIRMKERLNRLLPPDHYALVEQQTTHPQDGRIGPDVLTLQTIPPSSEDEPTTTSNAEAGGVALAAPPQTTRRSSTDLEFYRRKKSVVMIRHVSLDRVVAMVELVSPGNKSGRVAFAELVEKARDLLARGVHLLIVDLFPPTARDPDGIHAAVWSEFDPTPQPLDPARPLTAVSYECAAGFGVESYSEPLAVGDRLPDMPVFLRPGGCVMLPLEETYSSAYEEVPRRWQRVIEGVAE